MMDENMVKMMEKDRFAAYIGAELVEMQPGYAVVQMDVLDIHLNAADMIQGGAIFTLADFAFAAAANAGGQLTVGINVSISYLKSSQGVTLRAVAKEISASRRLVTYDLDVYNENDEHIAHLLATGYRKELK